MTGVFICIMLFTSMLRFEFGTSLVFGIFLYIIFLKKRRLVLRCAWSLRVRWAKIDA